MSPRDTLITALCALVMTPVMLASLSSAYAQVRQSTNYRIQSDSINFGGGLSTSTNYEMESTFGEVATGDSTGTAYNLRAGYQQMVSTFISMTPAVAVTMSPSIPGVTGGIANGSTTVTVTTDSAAGYTLTIEASQSPALRKGGDTIADYVPATANPDFTFTTNAADSHFGFSPSGIDIPSRFKDDGGACATGALDTSLACWDGLDVTPTEVARRMSANTPNGSTTTVNFRVGVGGSVVQTGGTYTATTTLTALPL